VVAADVVVPLEFARIGVIALALIPVAWRRNTVDQAAIMQYRKIEAATVPRHDLRRIALDAVEKTLDDLAFAVVRLGQRKHAEVLRIAQHAGNGHHALKMMRQEVRTGRSAALLEGELGHF